MYERCLSEAERILASHKEAVVPIRTVWHDVVRQSKRQKFEVPSIADFTTMLEADARFDFIPAHQSVVETVGLPENENDIEELELEKLGFFGEDGVRLRRMTFGETDEEEPEEPIISELERTPLSRSPQPTHKSSKARNHRRRNGVLHRPSKRALRKHSRKTR